MTGWTPFPERGDKARTPNSSKPFHWGILVPEAAKSKPPIRIVECQKTVQDVGRVREHNLRDRQGEWAKVLKEAQIVRTNLSDVKLDLRRNARPAVIHTVKVQKSVGNSLDGHRCTNQCDRRGSRYCFQIHFPHSLYQDIETFPNLDRSKTQAHLTAHFPFKGGSQSQLSRSDCT